MERGICDALEATRANEWAGPPIVNELHRRAAERTASKTRRHKRDDIFFWDIGSGKGGYILIIKYINNVFRIIRIIDIELVKCVDSDISQR